MNAQWHHLQCLDADNGVLQSLSTHAGLRGKNSFIFSKVLPDHLKFSHFTRFVFFDNPRFRRIKASVSSVEITITVSGSSKTATTTTAL